MKRKEVLYLTEWKSKKDRKPLIISGARQVGKTWLLKEFGSLEFKNYAYLNFESDESLKTIFEGGFDLNRILSAIEIITGIKVEPGVTLLVFDEIQEAPKALLALKFFYEQLPQLHLACAGSLLGIALGKKTSFPVGKVEFLDLYPLNFPEYLEAIGQGGLKEAMANQDWILLQTFNQKLISLLREYYYIGGMPEVVASFINDHDFTKARNIQNNILRTYQLDFSKHASSSIVPRIRMLWNSIPGQLSKENKKFLYKAVKPGARSKDYELALYWLIDAGLVYRISNLTAVQLPLKAYEDINSFKLFILDIGLLGAMVDLDVKVLLDEHQILKEYKGSMTEQYVVQQLKSQRQSECYYFSPSNQKSEIDFVFENNSHIWPLEVKAEENLQAKSLKIFYDLYHPLTSFRTSMSGYREQDWLTNIPLYAINEIFAIAGKR
ncbi:MAG: ATP-binding protein [Saprospiraceae bacterium]|uniref:ATP-binding protein n=1 Tax=Candidatus Opimibacter skivensis TaxID=2982028 RepID=A0A9D7SSE2_9BACT|nr:ATP-binding protein [Candidatus Opimibacter skivensis]